MCTCSVYIYILVLYYLYQTYAGTKYGWSMSHEWIPARACLSISANWSKLYQLYVYTYCSNIPISGLQTISRCWHCIVDPVSGIFPILPGSPVLPLNNREHHETTYRKKYRLTLLLVSRRIYVMCYVSCPASKAAPSHACQECSSLFGGCRKN